MNNAMILFAVFVIAIPASAQRPRCMEIDTTNRRIEVGDKVLTPSWDVPPYIGVGTVVAIVMISPGVILADFDGEAPMLIVRLDSGYRFRGTARLGRRNGLEVKVFRDLVACGDEDPESRSFIAMVPDQSVLLRQRGRNK